MSKTGPGARRGKPRGATPRHARHARRKARANRVASAGLDQLSTRAIVEAIHREDATVARAVSRELPTITRAVDAIVHALAKGGRLIYIGAGTSGRLAVLDAAECPPTFGVPAGLVTAVIAGGPRALTSAAEDAEDSALRGQHELAAKRLTRRDIVVGITASGATPYVLGALRFARTRGAATIGVTANRHSPITRLAAITISAQTGAEVIAGSTRMKAGTAQKMILNLLSTTAMVRLGHVYDHWMVDVALTNRKLRLRGVRILQEAAGASAARATRALGQANDNLRVAFIMLKTNTTAVEAKRRLRAAGGNLRRALGE